MRPDPRLTPAAPGTVLRRTDDKVDALVLTLVLDVDGGQWELRYMLVGDVLVCSSGKVGEQTRHYTVDRYTPSEARRLLLGYIEDNEREGFAMVGGVRSFTMTPHVYESVCELDNHRGHSAFIHRLFHIATHGIDP